MASFEKKERQDPASPDPLAGSLPPPGSALPDARPTPYALVTSLLPAQNRRPLPEMEVPERKAAFFNGLGSDTEDEFQFALGALKDWMPKTVQKIFWPVVLEVLGSPEGRQTFSRNIATRNSLQSGFVEVALGSLLEAALASTIPGKRDLRCQARILAATVWWAPQSLGTLVADAIEANPHLLRPFAVSLAFTAGAYQPVVRNPTRSLCRYLLDELTTANAQGAHHRDLLFSSGALQLLSTLSASLSSLSIPLNGRIYEGIFSGLTHLSSLRLFLESLYDRAEARHADVTPLDRAARFCAAELVTAEVLKLFPQEGNRYSSDQRDLFQRLLGFVFTHSPEKSLSAAMRLVAKRGEAQPSSAQRAAIEYVRNVFVAEPNSELTKHLAAPDTLAALLDSPGEMVSFAQKAKEALDEEARKTSPEVDGSLSAFRLEMLHRAQKVPPAMCWWKALALIPTEEVASQVLAAYKENRWILEDFLKITSSLLPFVKGPQDLKTSLDQWLAPSTQEALRAIRSYPEAHDRYSFGAATISFFLSREPGPQPAAEHIRIVVLLLKQMPPEIIPAFMDIASEASMSTPWQGAVAELQTYRSFVSVFGTPRRPTLYDAYRTLSFGSPWGAFSTPLDLLKYQSELLAQLCADEPLTYDADRLELELLDHICHLSTNTFGDREVALTTIRDWRATSQARQLVYSAAFSSAPAPGQDRGSWGKLRAAATRAEFAWRAFADLGAETIQLARKRAREPFTVSKGDFAGFYHRALSDFGGAITGDVHNFGKMLSAQQAFQEILTNHPIPGQATDAAVCAWQRAVLRDAVEMSLLNPVPSEQLDLFRLSLSFLALRTLNLKPSPDKRSYVRYNEAVYGVGSAIDQRRHSILWVDIGAGLFQGTLADEYLLSDVNWSADRRQAFLDGLRAALPCDSMAAALEGHSDLARSHPPESEPTEKTSLTVIPTRGLARELSGHLFDVCWASNDKAFSADKTADDGRPNIIGLTFVRDYNTPQATIVGGSLIVVGYNNDDTKQPVLIIRGCNPRSSFLDEVFVGEFFDQWIGYLHRVAQPKGMLVAIPADPVPFLALTNQPGLYYYARKRYFGGAKLNVGSVALTEFNGIRVGDRLRSIGNPL